MKANLLTLFLFISLAVHAQVCSGGLGDPIVDITFGAGIGFGPPLAPGITNMQYEAQACVLDNAYAIVSSTAGCYVGDWLTVSGDHTGDPNGYYMLIGASDQPSDFYVQTITGLCPGTTYQFAAWVLNMASHTGEILPNITFAIDKTDGTVLQSLPTGDIPVTNPLQWNQYAFSFTTPPGISSVIIRMTNNAPGGYGNDLALDDITFRAAGPSVSIAINGHTGDTVTLCAASSNTLQFIGTVGSCYTPPAYQWQQSSNNGTSWTNIPSAINPAYTASPVATGNYLYRLTAAPLGNIGITSCQVVSSPDTIVILNQSHPAISIQLNAGQTCADSLVTIIASVADTGTMPFYQWFVDEAPVTAAGITYSNDQLASGDRINCSMTSNAQCAIAPTALSNTLIVTLLPDINASVSVQASANDICQDSLVNFTATPTNGGSSPSYQWFVNGQPEGSDTAVYASRSLNNGDIVSLVMNSSLPCSTPATAAPTPMTVYEVPQIQLTPDTIIAGGSSIVLDPVITGAIDYDQWSPLTGLDDGGSLRPTATPVATTIYQLVVKNIDGCAASANEKVEVFYDLQMPNAFTPNGDGHNDLFRVPPSLNLTIGRFSVYNRWGALLFTTSNNAEGWDGRLGGQAQPIGTYIWVVEFYNPIAKRPVMKKGTVELIR